MLKKMGKTDHLINSFGIISLLTLIQNNISKECLIKNFDYINKNISLSN
jgi:hypothetical protein